MALIQLHGSLAWLREPRLGMYKFDLEALRSLGYWEALRNGQTDWLPVVVLTDQKERQIQRTPFSLAYDIFQRRLVAADHWLIAGYGLKDAPVNELFRTAAMTRKAIGLRAPKILVVDYGVEVDEKRKEASISLGLPENVIKVSVAGAPGALKTQEWNDWAT